MKILFFVSSMHAGGAERVAATLANAWAQRSDAVTLVVSYTKKGNCFYTLDPAVELLWLADRMGARSGPMLSGLKKWWAIRRLVQEQQPDLIVSFLTNVNVMVLAGTRGLGVPVIVCERTNPAASASSGAMLKQLRRWCYPWADLVTLQTQASVAPFKKMVPGIKDLAVIPNPLPPDLLDFWPAKTVSDNQNRRRLMAMGRLVPAKRFGSLIQAFSGLAVKYPDWDLVIRGEGPLRASLERQIHDAGLASRVFLPGRTDQPWQELAQADVFALTSEVEGFPNVLLEAMAMGRPCVAVDCPSGPKEITQEGKDALLIPLGDQPALEQALERLMADPDLRAVLGRRAMQSVRMRFALEQVLAQWDALFSRVRLRPRKGKQT